MKGKVLVVDDSLFMRSMIIEALSGAGYEIIGDAADGESAIEMALELKPDIITMDNVLPDMIGLDIIRILKEEEKLEAKFIVISAVGQEKAINEGMQLGILDYIIKPFTSEDLVAKVDKVCQ